MANLAPPSASAHEAESMPMHERAPSGSSTKPVDHSGVPILDYGLSAGLGAPTGVATLVSPVSADTPKLRIRIRDLLWSVFDAVVLFRMASIYLHRFEDFEGCDHPEHSEEREKEVTLWRKEQQKEWDRLSTTMALLGTMNAGIIKIAPDVKGVAPSLWLGAAGLSLCGVFLTTYYSIRAFPMTNSQIRNLVSGRRLYFIPRSLVAIAISAPTLMALWSSVLFVAGVVIFVSDTTFDRTRYKVFALLPLSAGVGSAVVSLIFGEIMGIVMYQEKRRAAIGTRWCTIHIRKDLPTEVQELAAKRNEELLRRFTTDAMKQRENILASRPPTA